MLIRTVGETQLLLLLGTRNNKKSHLRYTRCCELCDEDATTGTCKVSAIRTRVRVLNDAAQVRIRCGVAVGGVDERARLHGIDDGAPRLSVQRHLRIGY